MIHRFFYMLLLLTMPSIMAFSAPKLLTNRIQVLTPAQLQLKLSDTLNIALIANIYKDTRPDSLVKAGYPSDSLLAVRAALALKNRLEESPIFENYDFPVYNYKRDDDKTLKTPIPIAVAQQLADEVEADYLLTVDIVSTELWYQMGYNQYDDEMSVSYAATNVAYEFIFRFYDIKNNTIKNSQVIRDTLVTETSSFNEDSRTVFKNTEVRLKDVENLFKNILTESDAIFKAVEEAGITYADLIAPNWKDEIRYYYNDGSRGMKDASEFVEQGDWSKAMEIWLLYTSLSNQRQAAMGCFNMALGCEMMGDFELAVEWLNLARKKDSRLDFAGYDDVLQRRISDKAEIDKIL